MTKTIKNIPKLRFPEFRDAPAWEEKTLDKLLIIGNGRDYKHLSNGEIPVYGTGGYMLSVSDYLYDGESVCIGRKGTIDKPMFLTGKFWTVDTLFYTHSFKNCIPKYIFYIFGTINWYNYNEAGGVPSLSKTTINKINIPVPLKDDTKEQQKIADCLSSVDELIALQVAKVGMLKAHKKALMQQLFPREGKNTPRLRFPEFQDAPEWKEKKLSEVCKFVRGPFGGSLKKDIFVKDGYAVYEQSHAIYQNFDIFRYYITEEKFNELKRFSVNPNDIIMSCSGTMGKFAIIPKNTKEGVINQALLKLTVKKEFDNSFVKTTLELPINQEKLLSQSAGGAIKNVVSVDQIKDMVIYIPDYLEQQKIADCLSSIDELITSQSVKVEVLKQHKKALMQQLFPSNDKVDR